MSLEIVRSELPLFPLHTVLYPQGWLPLRIFEPRYVDMVRRCMRENSPFGVVLIRSGRETGAPAQPHSIGTTARIVDFDQGREGLLNILARGEQRFLIHDRRTQADTLQIATTEPLLDETDTPVPEAFQWLADVLRQLRDQTPDAAGSEPDRYGDGNWLAFRLAERLPLPPAVRQQVLETHRAEVRLALLAQLLEPVSKPH